MIWIIQSLICVCLFVVNFAWHPIHIWLAIVLNVLLALSCIGLLATSYQRQVIDSRSAYRDAAVRNAVIAVLFLLYLVASLMKLNGSSAAFWLSLSDQQPARAGLIAGTPKEIRLDEWAVHTPWIWSQANKGFPKTNRNVGNGVAPLVTNLPVQHWSILFRPQMWGFFFLDLERAFAFNWNFRWFGLLLGGFLALRIIARGNNFLALSGALLLLFSPYVQWFFSNPTNMPEMISMFCFGLWAFHALLKSPSRWMIFGASLVLLVAIEQFVFCCYPRYQVPLAYLAAALAAGEFYSSRLDRETSPETGNRLRLACLAATLVLAGTLLYFWYREIAATFAEIQASVFPGQVFSAGGNFEWFRFFAPFLEFSMTKTHYPLLWGNVCEASGFLFLAPLLLASLASAVWKRRVDPIFLIIVMFIAATVWFMLVGIPKWVAENSGWNFVVSYRGILAVGVASIIGLVRHLDQTSAQPQTGGIKFLWTSAVAAMLFFLCLYVTNHRMGDFATIPEVVAAAIFFTTAGFFIWRRVASVSCILLVLPTIYATALVNPVSCGVPGLAQNATLNWFSKIHRSDPGARWIVTGPLSAARNCLLAQLVKATGADVLGGTTYTADYDMVNALDPERRYTTVYTRWAASCFVMSDEAEPVFELAQLNAYRIWLPFRADTFERLGVKYIVLVDPEGPFRLPGFEQIGEAHGLLLLRHGP